MFDERWLNLLLLAGVIGALTRSSALIGLVLLNGILVLISHQLRRVALKGVGYRRAFSETRLFLGETVTVSCTAINHGRLPLISLYIYDSAPRGLQPALNDGAVLYAAGGRLIFSHLMALLPGAQSCRRVMLRPMRRGYYVFGQAELRAADLLGMFEVDGIAEMRDTLIVYPHVFPLEELGIPTREPYGALQALRGLIDDPVRIIGARDYEFGDSFRQIHWKATAHRGALQTRVLEYTSDPTAILFLNVATFEQAWRGSDPVRFEWAVSVAASIATWAHNAGAVVGLLANGNTPNAPKEARVRPIRSPDQLMHILESLAIIGPYTFFSFEQFLLNEQFSVPSGATQIVITPLLTPQIEIALRQLHERGKRVVLVCVERDAPDLQNMPFPAYHVPPSQSMRVMKEGAVL
jgi:uncharacterized protein (DUF58 family)